MLKDSVEVLLDLLNYSDLRLRGSRSSRLRHLKLDLLVGLSSNFSTLTARSAPLRAFMPRNALICFPDLLLAQANIYKTGVAARFLLYSSQFRYAVASSAAAGIASIVS